MSTDDRTAAQTTRFLLNRRSSLAGAHMDNGDTYSRFLSQYGENAVEPGLKAGWTFTLS